MVPSLTTRILLVLAVAVTSLAGSVFWRSQNRAGRMGGAISLPKMLWLAYAVGLWLLVTPLVACEPEVATPLKWTLAAFSAWMWVRAVAEAVLLYGTKSWRPPYGVAHDATCIALLVAGIVVQTLLWNTMGDYDRWVLGLAVLLVLSLAAEITYAARFHRAVDGATTGDQGLWFANADDERFRALNRLTTRNNVVLYSGLALFLLRSVLG